jgi:hypothetical protein
VIFGLSANGTNGGQTGVSPISIDAIEQFQVSVAPLMLNFLVLLEAL